MGSSKKSKDKDKDRDRNRDEKKKKKHRSRSRSRERDRHHRHKHRKRRHREHRSRSPLSDVSDVSSGELGALVGHIMEECVGGVVAVPPPPPPPCITTPDQHPHYEEQYTDRNDAENINRRDKRTLQTEEEESSSMLQDTSVHSGHDTSRSRHKRPREDRTGDGRPREDRTGDGRPREDRTVDGRPREDRTGDGSSGGGGGGAGGGPGGGAGAGAGGAGGGWEDESSSRTGTEGAGMSLSVSETNKIRAKLGLKPLQEETTVIHSVGGGGVAQDGSVITVGDDEDGCVGTYVLKDGEKRMTVDSETFVHKPPQNLRDKLQVDKLREKIAAQREKRLLSTRLGRLRTLGASDSEDDDAPLAWVSKNRKLSKQRLEAEKKQQQLEELDAQFGVGDLVEEEVAKVQRRAYGMRNLSGMKVVHHHSRFNTGNTILTLADSNVLDNEEDTLLNVNIVDQERVEKNLERRRNKEDETDYEAPELDELGNVSHGSMLKKYDEELYGLTTASFRLGTKGQALLDEDQLSGLGEKQRRLAKLRQLQSLSQPQNQLVNEYMTEEEVARKVVFRKSKKKGKKKKKMLTADDLLPLDDNEEHHGSRTRKLRVGQGQQEETKVIVEGATGEQMEIKQEKPDKDVTKQSVVPPVDKIKTLKELMEEDEEDAKKYDNTTNDDYDDYEGLNDDADDLQAALALSRKAKLSKLRRKTAEYISEVLKEAEPTQDDNQMDIEDIDELTPNSNSKNPPKSSSELIMTLNTTDEFCRTLGDIPTYGLSGNRKEDDQTTHLLPTKPPVEAVGGSGAWEEVGIEDTRVEISETLSVPILDEEPDASKGVANALRLAIKKGYLEKSQCGKKTNAALQHLRAVNYSIDDKAGDDDRRGRGGGDRYGGPLTDFKDKELYKPRISLEYVDDEGRKLCPKEAFRYLSHKFHGKGSGKNKTEKRMKKWKEEQLMRQMSSSDTPLQTLQRQIEKQKALGTSYLLLSGTRNQDLSAPTDASAPIRK